MIDLKRFCAVQERPILFYGPMVRAILDGRKTQTRRVVKTCRQFAEWDSSPEGAYDVAMADNGSGAHFLVAGDHGYTNLVPCPYGQPGDRLWVREEFNIGRALHNCEGVADDEELWIGRMPKDDPRKQAFMSAWQICYAADGCDGKMRPSIHMPRWASRLTLEITGARVERLQAISEADAIAEGVTAVSSGGVTLFATTGVNCSAKDAYAALWESINGPGSWDANPWVWVVEFRRVGK